MLFGRLSDDINTLYEFLRLEYSISNSDTLLLLKLLLTTNVIMNNDKKHAQNNKYITTNLTWSKERKTKIFDFFFKQTNFSFRSFDIFVY